MCFCFQGYPTDDAAQLVAETVRDYLDENPDKVDHFLIINYPIKGIKSVFILKKKFDRIIFCLFLEASVRAYNTYLSYYFPIEANQSEDKEEVEEEETAKKDDVTSDKVDKAEEKENDDEKSEITITKSNNKQEEK